MQKKEEKDKFGENFINYEFIIDLPKNRSVRLATLH